MARNVGLQELGRMSLSEYTIMIDADSMILLVNLYYIYVGFMYLHLVLGWDSDSIIQAFDDRENWDAICANGVMFNGIYRDTYAFRTDGNMILHIDDSYGFELSFFCFCLNRVSDQSSYA